MIYTPTYLNHPINYGNMIALCHLMDLGKRCIFLQIILEIKHLFLRFIKKNTFRLTLRVYKIE